MQDSAPAELGGRYPPAPGQTVRFRFFSYLLVYNDSKAAVNQSGNEFRILFTFGL